MKPDIQDLEAIKNKLYWERLNSGSQLSKIRKANPLVQKRKAVVKNKKYQDTIAHQKQKRAIFKRIDNGIELQAKYDSANIDMANGVTPPLEDTRSTTERLKDDFEMRKLALQNAQTLFGDREEAGTFMGIIQMDANLTKFFVQHFPQIYKDLKDKTNLIDAQYVKKYIDKYAEKINVTSGVDDTLTAAAIDKLLPNKKQFKNLIDAIQQISPPNAQVMTDIQKILARLEAFQKASLSTPKATVPIGSALPTSVDFTDLINAINDGNMDTQDLLRELQQILKDVNTNSLRKLLVAQGDKSIISNQQMDIFLSTSNGKTKFKIDEPELNKLITDLGYDLNDYPTADEKYKVLKDNKQLLQTVNKIIVNSPDEDIEMKLQVVARQYNINTIDDLILQVSNIERAFNIYLYKIPIGDPVPDGEITMYLDKIIPANGGNLTAIIQTPVSNNSQNNSPPSASYSASTVPINSSPITNIPNIGTMPLNLDFIPEIVDFASSLKSKSKQEQKDIIDNYFNGNKDIIAFLKAYLEVSNQPTDEDKINIFVSGGYANPSSQTDQEYANDLQLFLNDINTNLLAPIQAYNLSQNVAPPVSNNQLPFGGTGQLPLNSQVEAYLRQNPNSINDGQYYLNIYDLALQTEPDFDNFEKQAYPLYGDTSKSDNDNYDDMVTRLQAVNSEVIPILMTGSGLRKARKTPKMTRKSSHTLLDYFKNNKYR